MFIVRPTHLLLFPILEWWHLLAVLFTCTLYLPPSFPQLISFIPLDGVPLDPCWPLYIVSWGTTWTQSVVCPNFPSPFQLLAHYFMELFQCAFLFCRDRKARMWTPQFPMQPRCWMQIRFYILGVLEWDLKDRSKSFEATSPGKGQVFVQYCSSFHFWLLGGICRGDSSLTPLLAYWEAIHWPRCWQ